MSDELDDYEEQFKTVMADMKKLLADQEKATGTKRQDLTLKIDSKLATLKKIHQSYKLEIPELDKRIQPEYTLKSKKFAEDIAQVQLDITASRTASDRNELMSGGGNREIDVTQMSNKQKLQVADKLQDENKSSLSRTLDTALQTETIAVNIQGTLDEQTEQIKRVDESLDQISDQLKRADVELRRFMRRMATDRCIMVILCLIIALVVALIIYAIVVPDQTQINAPKVPS